MSNVAHGGGWGKQSWGGSGWGGAQFVSSGTFSAVYAYAPAENVVRFLFTQQPYFSMLLDEYDASDASHYSVQAVASTSGWDGNAARAVTPVQAIVSTEATNAIDVMLDRPMSPYPAQYVCSFENLASSAMASVLTGASYTLFGVYKKLQPQLPEITLPTADFANPQTASAVQSSALGSALGPSAQTLGVFQVDSSGDYAFDAGVQVIKKRIIRRGLARKGAFAHLPASYGVGLADAVKQLGRAAVRDRYAADYQAQILQEPEVVAAKVTAIQDPALPELVHFLIEVRTRTGTSLTFDHPLNTVAGVSLVGGA